MNILAMDLGKNNTVICIYDTNKAKGTYRTIKTLPAEIHNIIAEYNPKRVVFEICSIAGWVYDIAKSLVNEVEVADVNHQAWRWKNIKSKNDRKDALKLAQLSAVKQINCVHIPKKGIRQKRALINYRQGLVGRRTQVKNNIRSILDKQGFGHIFPKIGKGSWTKHNIELLNKMAKKIELCSIDDLWKGQLYIELESLAAIEQCIGRVEQKLDELAEKDKHIKVLRTIPGVGPRLSEAIAAYIDEPTRFKNGKQVGSYIGLTPRQYQSGEIDRQGRISGQGNKVLRSLLVEVCWLGLRNNQWMRDTYYRILRGSKSRKKIAITAVARKLLVRCWAMMRDGSKWRQDEQVKGAA